MAVTFIQLKRNLHGLTPIVLGLSLVLLSQASLRFSGMTGIYPVETSLTIRHILTVCVLAIYAFILFRPNTSISAGKLRMLYIMCSVTLSVCFAFSYGLNPAGGSLVIVAEIAKESLVALLLVIWAHIIFPLGKQRSIIIFGTAAAAMGVFQLTTCWLQYQAHLVFIVVLPLLSIVLFYMGQKEQADIKEIPWRTADKQEVAVASSLFVQSIMLVALFCLMLVIGQVIYMALEQQQSMSTSVFAEISMGIGNLVGGGTIALFSKELCRRQPLSIMLFGTVAFIAIAFYTSTILSGVASGAFLAVSSFARQIASAFAVSFVFLNAETSDVAHAKLARYAVTLLAMFGAQAVSTTMMIAYQSTESIAYQALVATVLTVLVFCCIALLQSSQQSSEHTTPNHETTSRDSYETPMPIPAAEHTASSELPNSFRQADVIEPLSPTEGNQMPLRPFHQAISNLSSQHLLTPQESNILAQLAQGLNARSISEAMVLSSNTVRSHMRNVYAKLDVHSQQELIALVNERVDAIKEETRTLSAEDASDNSAESSVVSTLT